MAIPTTPSRTHCSRALGALFLSLPQRERNGVGGIRGELDIRDIHQRDAPVELVQRRAQHARLRGVSRRRCLQRSTRRRYLQGLLLRLTEPTPHAELGERAAETVRSRAQILC